MRITEERAHSKIHTVRRPFQRCMNVVFISFSDTCCCQVTRSLSQYQSSDTLDPLTRQKLYISVVSKCHPVTWRVVRAKQCIQLVCYLWMSSIWMIRWTKAFFDGATSRKNFCYIWSNKVQKGLLCWWRVDCDYSWSIQLCCPLSKLEKVTHESPSASIDVSCLPRSHVSARQTCRICICCQYFILKRALIIKVVWILNESKIYIKVWRCLL